MLTRHRTTSLVLAAILAALPWAALPPAHTATNVMVSGVVTDSAGQPVENAEVSTTASLGTYAVSTAADGSFSFPVTSGTSTGLIVRSPYVATGHVQVSTTALTFASATDLGRLALPPLSARQTVRVVDDHGTPVFGAAANGAVGLTASTWADHGWQLSDSVTIAEATYLLSARTDAAGELLIDAPRLLSGGMPSLLVRVYRPGGGEFTANLADATSGDPRTLTVGGFTVGPPSKPVVRFATATDGRADVQFDEAMPNGSPVTGYSVVSQPGGHRGEPLLGSTTYYRVEGLTNETPYTFTVTAHSPAGDVTSAPSAVVVPRGQPSIPGGTPGPIPVPVVPVPVPVVPGPLPAPEPAAVTVPKPVVVGKARVGTTVKLAVRPQPASAKVVYRWFAGGKKIKKAKAAKLRLTKAMVGKKLTVRVTATAPGLTTWSRTVKVGKVKAA